MRIAVYAGTFDPVTAGHLSVIEKSSRLFDRLIVLVAVNPEKSPMFSAQERVAMLEAATLEWDNVVCESTNGFVVHHARKRNAMYLVRGVRDATDSQAETALASLNRSLAPEITTIFIPADPHLASVSSSRLKEMARNNEDLSCWCPLEVSRRLSDKTQRSGTPRGDRIGSNRLCLDSK